MDLRTKKLEELYANKSRHSHYQILASNIENLVHYDKPEKSKYEKERLDYIKQRVAFENKKILDIGGNTGYFTFESCRDNPKSVDYFEGNKEHAEFVKLASEIIGLSNIINVNSDYFLFEKQEKIWDVVFFLNVIHHIGFDFEKNVTSINVRKKMIEHINCMAEYSKIMIFQMGFNWYGNIEKCLFDNGTKKEMIDYLKEGTKDYWEIKNIGIPVKKGENFIYEEINLRNSKRIDEYGEFLNRPLFIFKSNLV